MHLQPMGDGAVVIKFGSVIKASTLAKVRAATAVLEDASLHGVIDIVPSYTTVTVIYDPVAITGYAEFYEEVRTCLIGMKKIRPPVVMTLTIPVCYGGEYGPDLAAVAQRAKLSERAVIALHARPKYVVGAVGFTPGFAYLSGLAKKLHTPRKAVPLTKVPAGSVGIGGGQTGIYPLESPGGWQLIGRTPLTLFNVKEDDPALLRVGDQVQFKAISEEEFTSWK